MASTITSRAILPVPACSVFTLLPSAFDVCRVTARFIPNVGSLCLLLSVLWEDCQFYWFFCVTDFLYCLHFQFLSFFCSCLYYFFLLLALELFCSLHYPILETRPWIVDLKVSCSPICEFSEYTAPSTTVEVCGPQVLIYCIIILFNSVNCECVCIHACVYTWACVRPHLRRLEVDNRWLP